MQLKHEEQKKNEFVRNVRNQVIRFLGIEHSITSEYKEAIDITIIAIAFKKTDENKAIVIPIITGGGKSTLINYVAANYYNLYVETSGVVILKLYKNDCNETANEINRIAKEELSIEKDIAIAFHSDNKVNPRILGRFPIIITTHEMIKRRIDNLELFKKWSDFEPEEELHNCSYYRTKFIIDEEVDLVKYLSITNESLAELDDFFQRSGNEGDIIEFNAVTDIIKSRYFKKPIDDSKKLYWTKPSDINLSHTLKNVVYEYPSDEILDKFQAIENFVKNGGYVQYSDDSRYRRIETFNFIDIFSTEFEIVILDGTSRTNNIYAGGKFQIIDTPIFKTFNNTILHIYDEVSGSRNSLEKVKNLKDELKKHIENNQEEGQKILIVTHKSFQECYLNHFEFKINYNVEVRHWGELKGKNDFRDFDTIYLLGIQFFHESYYRFLYHCYFQDNNFESKNPYAYPGGLYNKTRRFIDEDYEKIRQSVIAKEVIQYINRIRCRYWVNGDTYKSHVYLILNDSEIEGILKKTMPDVKVHHDWEMSLLNSNNEEITKPIHSAEIVKNIILNHKVYFGHRKEIRKGDFFQLDELKNKCLSKKTRSKVWNSSILRELQKQNIIVINNKNITII